MPLESEVRPLLVIFFSLVMIIFLLFIVYLYYKTRNKKLGWFVLQFISLILSFYSVLNMVDYNYLIESALHSEHFSPILASAGLWWGISTIFMIIGIVEISLNKVKKI